ncbi:MAG TPA: nitroreductase, partial [Lachnoclostridium sp.]|nr:nitroreductase [Lachnoclostridium sp.]
MNLYQMIFKRRSIKKYKKEPVPEQFKRDILYFGDCVSRLYGDIQVKMEICDSTEDETPA